MYERLAHLPVVKVCQGRYLYPPSPNGETGKVYVGIYWMMPALAGDWRLAGFGILGYCQPLPPIPAVAGSNEIREIVCQQSDSGTF